MRPYRVFNNVADVPIEWWPLGQRYRMLASTLLLCVLAGAAILAVAVSGWLGLSVFLLGAPAVVVGNWMLNQMNPTGALRESTLLALVYRTARHPIITEPGRH